MAYSVVYESIASFSDIEAATTREFSADELVVGHSLLQRYQKEIETILKRPLSVLVTDEPVARGGGPGEDSVVLTRFRPVQEVTEIVPDDLTYVITRGIVYLPYSLMYPLTDTTETISYRARLPEHEIDSIRSLMVDRAIRVLVKEQDDARGTASIGEAGYTATYLPEDFTPAELAALPPKKKIIL